MHSTVEIGVDHLSMKNNLFHLSGFLLGDEEVKVSKSQSVEVKPSRKDRASLNSAKKKGSS